MIAVIDYGSGNLPSIRRALEAAGAETVVTPDPDLIREADAVVLPGVGHAGYSMRRLRELGIDRAVLDAVGAGKPFLGICVGMQVMFGDQEEGGAVGLGLLGGRVRSLGPSLKVPHMGWNRSRIQRSGPAGDAESEAFYYFVHSYVAEPDDETDVAATVAYGERFPSIVVRDNVWGTQFHPEKSGDDGLALIARFVGQLSQVQRRRIPAGTVR